MSQLEFTFRIVRCKNCGKDSDEVIMFSLNTLVPPPKNISYDGTCSHCYSENTEIIDSP